MRNLKKAVSLLLALAMVCSLLTVSASAAGDYEGKTVILYTGNVRGDVTIYARIKALKDSYQAAGAEVLLMDAGNFLQGSVEANLDRGQSVYALMDAAGYDAAAMGLAEFGYADAATGMIYHGNVTRYYTQAMLQDGTEEVEYNVNRDGSVKAALPAREAAGFVTLSANMKSLGDAYSFRPSVELTTEGGLRILVEGFTDPAVPGLVQDGFVEETEPQAADPEDYDLVVFLSNQAEWTAELLENQIAVCAPTGGTRIAGACVIDNATKAFTLEDVDLNGESDGAVAALAEDILTNARGAREKSAGTSQVILNGADSVNWAGESNLGDLTADALRWYAENYIDGYDKSLPLVAIQNGGNCDQFLYTGDITETDLLRALPFSPMGVGVLEVTGQQLLEALEAGTCPTERYGTLCPGFAQVSGLRYAVNLGEDYDGGQAYGSFFRADSVNRVTILSVDGKPFDPQAKYAVVADNYVLNGSDTYYTFADVRQAEDAIYVNNGNGVLTRDVVALYVKNRLGGVIGAEYAKPQGRITVGKVSFDDVRADDYFFAPVSWAVENGVTNGKSAASFAPGDPCTRAQFVTLLWRAMGSPAAAGELAFSDVDGNSAYADAIRWAAAQGITTGVGGGRFGPDRPVNRGQAVTFLHRALDQEAPAGESFTDLTQTWYQEAVAWAVAAGVTNGTGAGRFSPARDCKRSEVVTFLYRALAE